MTIQLRIYTINKGKLDDFVNAWKGGIVPLRHKFGFKIEGAWAIKERNEFVWMMSYDGVEGWEKADAAYYASPERKTLNPDPAQYIAQMNYWFVTPILTK